MNTPEFNAFIESGCNRTKNTLIKKSVEYATDSDRFHNFNSAVDLSFHNTREKVAWEFMCKHLQSIKDIIENVDKNKLPTNELLSEKFGDAHCYLHLIEAMIFDRLPVVEEQMINNSKSVPCPTKSLLFEKLLPSPFIGAEQ